MILVSRDLGFSCVMSHQFAYLFFLYHGYGFPLMLVSGYSSYLFTIAGSRYAQFRSRLLTVTRLDDILVLTFMDLTPACTCSPRTCIYTGLEMGRSPSSIYFATTLVL